MPGYVPYFGHPLDFVAMSAGDQAHKAYTRWKRGEDIVPKHYVDYARQSKNIMSNAFGFKQPPMYRNPIGPVYKRRARRPVSSRTMVRYRRPRRYRRRPRRYSRRRRPVRRIRSLSVMAPRQKLVKFRCVNTLAVTNSTPANLYLHTWKANSLNDPFGADGAQLPLGLDQWAAFYQKSVVVASRVLLQVHNSSSTGSIIIGVNLRPDTTNLADAQYYREVPMVRSKILSPDMDHTGLGLSFGAKRFFKVRKFMDAEDQQASFSATPGDPTDLAYYHVWHQDLDKSNNYTVEIVATIEYICLLFDPITPSRSSL